MTAHDPRRDRVASPGRSVAGAEREAAADATGRETAGAARAHVRLDGIPDDRSNHDHQDDGIEDAGDATGFDAPIRRHDPVTRAALAIIRGYKLAASPLMPPACRFVPTCSEYGYEAVAKYGIIKGGRLAIWRILRCNPFGRGGYDPVP